MEGIENLSSTIEDLPKQIKEEQKEEEEEEEENVSRQCSFRLLSLTLHSLGIIFGDIGTSPLYVLQTIFHKKRIAPNEFQCIGAVSLILWSLILIVSMKYCIFILQADNRGEGGTFALCALLTGKSTNLNRRTKSVVNIVSILAASLLIGDGALTPAVSVLSAVEGLALNAPNLHRWVVPITVVIICSLFVCQQWGTAKIGYTFGPIMFIWFSSLFSIGIWRIGLSPSILKALNPYQAILYLIREKQEGFSQIGGVFLSVTGCEALFADLGHFGPWPIRFSWFFIVFPSVVVNYLGQGALMIHHPQSFENPFYRSVPEWFHWPMVVLATIATIIASQAIITGCFSLLNQACSLGFCAPLRICHTNDKIIGQIYVPTMNWMLLMLTLLMTVYFQSSSRLTNAYGLTVCSVSVITTLLFLMVLHYVWKKSSLFVVLFSFFLIIDCFFWSANAMKFVEGAWIAILIALIFFLIAYCWYYGEERLKRSLRSQFPRNQLNNLSQRFGLTSERQSSIFLVNNPLQDCSSSSEDEDEDEKEESRFHFLTNIPLSTISNGMEFHRCANEKVLSVTPGVGVFLTDRNRLSPDLFENYLRLIRSVPQMLIFVRIRYARIPFVAKEKRLSIKCYGNVCHLTATFGYGEKKKKCLWKDILLLAKELYQSQIPSTEDQMTYFLANQMLIISAKGWKTCLIRAILSLYCIEKSLLSTQSTNLTINYQNTIQIGSVVQL